LFATLQGGDGSLAQVYCDSRQHFVFERTDRNGIVQERTFSCDPRDFHDYTRTLGLAGWSFAWANG
jgi:hypothetical protein